MTGLAPAFALGALAMLAFVACQPAVPATPTLGPKPAATRPLSPEKVGAEGLAAPTPVPSPATKPAQAEWQARWERTLAAAKQEGRVVVAGPPGESFRGAGLEFQQKYPDITVEYTGMSGGDYAPRRLAEMRAGQNSWDIHIGGSQSQVLRLKPEGALDPIRPALILPEALDNSKWFGGFDDGFMDVGEQFVYAFFGRLSALVHVNRDFIAESELIAVDQLVEPRWKGKISWNDPRFPGAGAGHAGYWLAVKGEDWLRQLLQQDLTLTRDLRQQVEWMVRGQYPIAIGADATQVDVFQREGVGLRIEGLAPLTLLGGRISPGFGCVSLQSGAPHPNAATVYLNWLLSQEGQTTWASVIQQDSRRLDVTRVSEAPNPNLKYLDVSKEANQRFQEEAIELAKQLLK